MIKEYQKAGPMDEETKIPQILLNTTLASIPGNEYQAMEQVVKAVHQLNLPPEQLANLKTAVAEAVMNAMEHGNHYQSDKVVTLQLLASKSTIIVRIRDQGEELLLSDTIATPDLAAKLAGLQTPRGWGLFLIKNLVDELNISRDGQQNTVELTLYRQRNQSNQ